MKIDLKKVISIDDLKTNAEQRLRELGEGEELVIIDENKPAYVISRFSTNNDEKDFQDASMDRPDYSLQEAMKIVLKEQPEKMMHAAELAEEIFNRNLYWKRDGNMAEYNQIRARVGHYPRRRP